MTEAPITTTLKAPGANAPWMVIRSENTPQLNAQLSEIQANGIFATLAAANEAFAAHFTVGSILGAKPLNAPQDTGAFTPGINVVPPAPAAPTQQELFAQFMAAQETQGLPQAAPAAAPTAPATAAQYGGAPTTPGAPLVAGMPAKLISGSSAKGPWQAWADPRPKEMTEHITTKTDDVNDPGLQNGTKKFWKWIR